jgi:predicted AAA+ superfamily ATPase
MSTYLDIEVYADREGELEALFAELAAEEGDELPPIIQDEVPNQDFWEEAA